MNVLNSTCFCLRKLAAAIYDCAYPVIMNDIALIAGGSVPLLKCHSAEPKVVFSLIMECEQMREWKKIC